MYHLLQYMNKDNREYLAPIYHILIKTTKNKNEELSYDNFLWIINTANCKHMWRHFSTIVPYDFLFYYDEVPLVAKNFEEDWDVTYDIDIHGNIKKHKNGKPIILKSAINLNLGYLGFLSEATRKDLDTTILQWKIYGKYMIRISNFLSMIFRKFKSVLHFK